MRECPRPEDVHVPRGDDEIPQEVASSKALDHTACASVSPYALLPGHVLPVIVNEHDPECNGVDEAALDKRHDMRVPADLPSVRELGIDVREEDGGEDGRNRIVDDSVQKAAGQDFMYVEGQRREAEEVGDGLDGVLDPWDRLYGERVLHLERVDRDAVAVGCAFPRAEEDRGKGERRGRRAGRLGSQHEELRRGCRLRTRGGLSTTLPRLPAEVTIGSHLRCAADKRGA